MCLWMLVLFSLPFMIALLLLKCCSQNEIYSRFNKVNVVRIGANLEIKDRFGGTPFLYACWNGQVDVVRFLMAAGKMSHIKYR